MHRGLRLEYVTLSWNIVGTIVVILAAVTARSVALAGFALDSVIEIFASVVVVWQLQGSGKNREQRALDRRSIFRAGALHLRPICGGHYILL
ncbi:MAG: hypothetical protein ABI700_00120 [Chloroflexota bacterium]